MGWMASWLAVQGAGKAEIFEYLGLIEAGKEALPGLGLVSFSCREFPDNWLVVFSENFEWANPQRLLDLSRFGLALACQFEDKVEMTSSLAAARDGVEIWRVHHDSTGSIYRLDVTGEAPEALAAIRDAAFDLQREDGGEDSIADFVHDVALDLGKSICGFRAGDDLTPFTGLKGAGGRGGPGGKVNPGFASWLLAGFRSKR